MIFVLISQIYPENLSFYIIAKKKKKMLRVTFYKAVDLIRRTRIKHIFCYLYDCNNAIGRDTTRMVLN